MASTNSTTHYELSQYIGTDKPTYLVDYNQDMSKIDAGIYGAKSEADTNATAIGTLSNLQTTEKSNLVGAVNEVNTNSSNNATHIGDLTNLTTTEKSNLVGAVNELKTEADGNKTNIGTLANLTTTEKANLVGAINEVNSDIGSLLNVFNLSSINVYEGNDFSVTGGSVTSGTITIAKNSDSSICKIYGRLILNKTNQLTTITIANTGINVQESFVVQPSGCEAVNSDNVTSITFNTDGSITLKSYGGSGNVTSFFFPFVIFVKDFGDTPI